jgi:cytochrome P450
VSNVIKTPIQQNDVLGPLSNTVDFIKPLQYLPLPIRSQGRNLRKDFIDVYGAMIQKVKDSLEAGEKVPDCLVKKLLEVQETEKLSWTDLCELATAFVTGGTFSTSGTLQWFLAIMPSHPEIQARAQEELDRVVGRQRWPTFEDEAQLPYVRAIIKEVSISSAISLSHVLTSILGLASPFTILECNTSLLRKRFRL